MTRHSLYLKLLSLILITFIFSMFSLMFYMHGPLQGNFNHFFLPAKKFDVPVGLKEKGVSNLFHDQVNSGWDGQFYYYISNDIFGTKDVPKHIDSVAYRYQRIGLPLAANIVSKVFLQDWVSPIIYYGTSLMLLLLATGIGGLYFEKNNVSCYWMLMWALGFGSQVTQLNGLPDVAADAFLIISLSAIFLEKKWVYLFSMIFAVLSREVYVLIPFFFIFSECLSYIRLEKKIYLCCKNIKKLINAVWLHVLPIVIFISWFLYIKLHFGLFSFSQSGGALGLPFANTFKYFIWSANGSHPLLGGGLASRTEAVAIIMHVVILLLVFYLAIMLLFKKNYISPKKESPKSIGFALGILTIILLYLCFGKIVMMYRTGYLKASNIFFFVIPFLCCLRGVSLKFFEKILLLVVFLFYSTLLWGRVNGHAFNSVRNIAYSNSQPSCLLSFNAKIKPLLIPKEINDSFINRFIFKPSIKVDVLVENISKEVFSPFLGKGSVNLSYHWLKQKDLSIFIDGNREPLPARLLPNQKVVVPIMVSLPSKPGKYILRISLVQEGCAWFYNVNSNSKYDIFYTIK